MNNKVLTLLGFASKAGKLSYGMEATKFSLSRRRSHLVLASFEISEKSRKEAAFVALRGKAEFVTLEKTDIATISKAVGKRCGIISVNDKGFSEAVLGAIKGGNANDK